MRKNERLRPLRPFLVFPRFPHTQLFHTPAPLFTYTHIFPHTSPHLPQTIPHISPLPHTLPHSPHSIYPLSPSPFTTLSLTPAHLSPPLSPLSAFPPHLPTPSILLPTSSLNCPHHPHLSPHFSHLSPHLTSPHISPHLLPYFSIPPKPPFTSFPTPFFTYPTSQHISPHLFSPPPHNSTHLHSYFLSPAPTPQHTTPHLSQSPYTSTHFPTPLATICLFAHLLQTARFPKCLFVPMLIGPRTLLCPKVPFPPNAHLSQYPLALNAHLSHIPIGPKVLICSNCPFVPIHTCSQGPIVLYTYMLPMPVCRNYPFVLVHIFRGPHLPQSAHYAPNAHLPQCSLVPKCPFTPKYSFIQMSICPSPHMLSMLICPIYLYLPDKCPFALALIFPGVHLSQVPICPQCPLAPMSIGPNVPVCSTVPICLINAHLLWRSYFLVFMPLSQVPICSQCPLAPKLIDPKCSFVLVLTCFQRPFVPNALFPQSAHLPQLPIYPGAHFSWCLWCYAL